jgi:SAM-dependent methyltransferase
MWLYVKEWPVVYEISCPICRENGDLVPYEQRFGVHGNLFNLAACRTCMAILNADDLTTIAQGSDFLTMQGQAPAALLSDDYFVAVPERIDTLDKGFVQYLLRHSPNIQRRVFLDFGAGRGELMAAAARHFTHSYGVEIDTSPMRQVADRCGYPINSNIIERLNQVREQEVDAVSFIHVLEHLPSITGILEPIVKLLAPGGVILFQVPMAKKRTHQQVPLYVSQYPSSKDNGRTCRDDTDPHIICPHDGFSDRDYDQAVLNEANLCSHGLIVSSFFGGCYRRRLDCVFHLHYLFGDFAGECRPLQ